MIERYSLLINLVVDLLSNRKYYLDRVVEIVEQLRCLKIAEIVLSSYQKGVSLALRVI